MSLYQVSGYWIGNHSLHSSLTCVNVNVMSEKLANLDVEKSLF